MSMIVSGLTALYGTTLGKISILGLGGSFGISAIFKTNAIITDLSNHILAGGSAALVYVGATKNLQESCNTNSTFSCQVLDYTNSSLAIISALFGVAIIANAFIRLVKYKSIIDLTSDCSKKSSQKSTKCLGKTSQKIKGFSKKSSEKTQNCFKC